MELRSTPLRQTIFSGLAAGAAGGILLNLYLVLTIVLIRRWTDPGTLMKFVAQGVMGQKAFSNPSAVLIGTVIFYSIALLWGLGYAYVASTEPPLVTKPLISGAVFGVVVYIVMQVVELTVKIWSWHSDSGLFLMLNSIAGHILAFGIPVAYIVARWPHRS